jgi:ribosomal protein L14E/L6E/L27E
MSKPNQTLALTALFFRRLFATRWFKILVSITLISLTCLKLYKRCTKQKKGKEEITNTVFISEIRALGKLELTKITIKDVMEYKMELDWALDKKVLMVFGGEVVGCIDLAKIKEENITITDSIITIKLGETEICYSKLDHSKTKLYNLSTLAEFNKIEPEMMDYLYKKGEAYLVSDSMKMVVNRETEANAQKILKPLLEKISKKHVELVFEKNRILN